MRRRRQRKCVHFMASCSLPRSSNSSHLSSKNTSPTPHVLIRYKIAGPENSDRCRPPWPVLTGKRFSAGLSFLHLLHGASDYQSCLPGLPPLMPSFSLPTPPPGAGAWCPAHSGCRPRPALVHPHLAILNPNKQSRECKSGHLNV